MQTADRYGHSSLGHAVPTEQRRLAELSAMQDPATFALVEELGIQDDWTCLDLGAGNGSVAEWLATRVPNGNVIAADIDTRHLRDGVPRMTVVRHDVTRDEFPTARFDLVHARLLLGHVPDPETVLERIVRWLKPGGHLVVGGFDFSIGASSPQPQLARLTRALDLAIRHEIGGDVRFERRAPELMRRLDMTDIRADYHPVLAGAGQSGTAALVTSLEQLRPLILGRGWGTDQDFAELVAWLNQPGSTDVFLVRPVISARRRAE